MFKGYRHTEEAKAKIRLAGNSALGHVVKRETREKLRLANIGKPLTKERSLAISKALKGRVFSEKHRANLSLASIGKPLSEEHKRKCGVANLGKHPSEEARAKVGKASKLRWNNLNYKNRVVKAIRLALLTHPNKPETIIMSMLESICPGEFKFVGDGQIIIAGKNPDFININGHKQIIELFGDYWHGERARCFEETEKGRIKLFKRYGFDTLIIWEGELKTPLKVMNKITNFTKRNCFERLLTGEN